jgi:hypothetical protein
MLVLDYCCLQVLLLVPPRCLDQILRCGVYGTFCYGISCNVILLLHPSAAAATALHCVTNHATTAAQTPAAMRPLGMI